MRHAFFFFFKEMGEGVNLEQRGSSESDSEESKD